MVITQPSPETPNPIATDSAGITSLAVADGGPEIPQTAPRDFVVQVQICSPAVAPLPSTYSSTVPQMFAIVSPLPSDDLTRIITQESSLKIGVSGNASLSRKYINAVPLTAGRVKSRDSLAMPGLTM